MWELQHPLPAIVALPTHSLSSDRQQQPAAFAMWGSRGPTAGRAWCEWRGGTRIRLALPRAPTTPPTCTLTLWARRLLVIVRPVPATHSLQSDRQHQPAAFVIWTSRGPTAGRAMRVWRGSTRIRLALPRAPPAPQARTSQLLQRLQPAPARRVWRTRAL
jgi:hypothetical protein